jgi:predicted nucleotide-binding protein (sugar kinase/HSP70/actin superfamily)
MTLKIGIPRALYYHKFYPTWHTFFTELGAEVVLSQLSDKNILKQGSDATVDEFCLPIKVFFGHVNTLLKRCDLLFIPRLISTENETYYCPKFFGLPDMVRVAFNDAAPILEPTFNVKGEGITVEETFVDLGRSILKGKRESIAAYKKAVEKQSGFQSMVNDGMIPPEAYKILFHPSASNKPSPSLPLPTDGGGKGGGMKIALIGHPYNIYDSFVSMNIIKKLMERNIRLMTKEMFSEDIIKEEMEKLRRPVYWASGREIVGAANHLLYSAEVDGIIFIGAFQCGPDSLLKTLIEREAQRNSRTPLLTLSFDEHSGEAGLITRLEAFLDMLAIRKRRAIN